MVVVQEVAPQFVSELHFGLEPHPVHDLGLQRVKERLHVRVVLWPPARGALTHPQGDQAIPKRRRGILTAPIAVEDQTAGRPAAAHRSVEHGARQPRIAAPAERPGEHPAASTDP